ncbi:LpxL/LpxP family Kdo(2)-lipid IV(A) lauroyl/palmitoleoyl acyltransferase [Leminorella richardii]|uniref:LpxL/LpxP family Kdo(2)-lipid IV(A) lauroyl/palmitoleoyl acyltransferase n=1 Tax=Leminorella richardii TaxID=158841 RepID=UPI0022B298A4|nr:LpxL/LpxP family Kdo(2)-lipid IV(A) lauroyl/palmitoleoyl acyltransferase [Leminorella richardii]
MKPPRFHYSFLMPKYWHIWFGLTTLYLLVQLPYPVIYFIGTRIGRLSMRFLSRRRYIARRNIELCFPALSEKEKEKMLVENFESLGMGLFETGMAWFWSDRRIKKWCKVDNLEIMSRIREGGRGVLLVGIHFLTLELGGRIYGMYNPGIGVYRPHNNKLMDWVQFRGRSRSNKAFIDRRDVKGMVSVLKKGEILWYAPDHDYGPRNSVFAPFFAVPHAATTVGTSILMRRANPAILPFTPKRHADGSGYTVLVTEPPEGFPMDDTTEAAAFMNKVVENEILKAPELYMWLHRRFKTRPAGEVSLY